jgi:hypothetical protein
MATYRMADTIPTRWRSLTLAAVGLLIGVEVTIMADARAQTSAAPPGGVTSSGPGEKRPSTRTPEEEARAKPRMPLVDECDFPGPLPAEIQERCKAPRVAPSPGPNTTGRTPQERPGR